MIKKQDEEITSLIDKENTRNNKYVFHGTDGKIYITLNKGNIIKKDFSIFALNYRNNKKLLQKPTNVI